MAGGLGRRQADILADIRLVGMTNVVCQVGIAQEAVAAALNAPDADADMAAATEEWRLRCHVVLERAGRLTRSPTARGGWSVLVDARPLGLTPHQLSHLLFPQGPGRGHADRPAGDPAGQHYLRLVFANEPVGRLAGLRERFRAAIG